MITRLSKSIAENNFFQQFIILTIIAAGILVGIETYPAAREQFQTTLHYLDVFVLVIFTFEVVVKILAEGNKPWRFFYSSWNVFDFIIVAGGVLEPFLEVEASWLVVLRLLRILRVLRLVTALPKLQMLVGALLRSIPSISYVGVLMFILFYIYAVLGVMQFGQNDPVHFGDLETAMLSLFRIVTLEDWTDIMYINMFGCDNYAYAPGACTNPRAMPGFAVGYFVTFVLLGTMIILNLFIGVVMTSMEETAREKEADDRNKARKAAEDAAADGIDLRVTPHQELENLNRQLMEIATRISDLQGRLPKDNGQPREPRKFPHTRRD